MASDSSYTTTDHYGTDTTETVPSADSNYLTNVSDHNTIRTITTEKTNEDTKHDNIPPDYQHKSRTNMHRDNDDEQKSNTSSLMDTFCVSNRYCLIVIGIGNSI